MAAESTATTVWQGDLAHGEGTTSPGSGAFPDVPVSWASRTARSAGKTSPEEMLAAAHASCYSMALSNELGQAGTPPDRLTATATVTFEPGQGVTSSRLVVRGVVPGVDEETFAGAARAAGDGCPISQALKGNIEITVDAALDS